MKKAQRVLNLKEIIVVAIVLIVMVSLIVFFTDSFSKDKPEEVEEAIEDTWIRETEKCDIAAMQIGIVGEYYCEVNQNMEWRMKTENSEVNRRLLEEFIKGR